MVGSKPKNAFIAGSMVVALWAQHADFGQVFIAYLLDACPYLIPKYHQRPSNATGLFNFTGKKLDIRKVLVTPNKTFLISSDLFTNISIYLFLKSTFVCIPDFKRNVFLKSNTWHILFFPKWAHFLEWLP